jgi:hypothetical protein
MFVASNKASPKRFPRLRHAPIFCFVLRRNQQRAILTLGALSVCLLIATGCDGKGAAKPVAPGSDIVDQSSFPLVPSKSLLNLGEVPAGGRKQCDFWLTNQTNSPVEVAEIETGCDCLTIDLPNRSIAPGQKVEGRALLDFRHEPRFTGRLSIEVKGKEKAGEVVFALVVKVSVGSE